MASNQTRRGDGSQYRGRSLDAISLLYDTSSSEDDQDNIEPPKKRRNTTHEPMPSSSSKGVTTTEHQELSQSPSHPSILHTLEQQIQKDDRDDKPPKKRSLNDENPVTSSSTVDNGSSNASAITNATPKPFAESAATSSSTRVIETPKPETPSQPKDTIKPAPLLSKQVVDKDDKASKRRNYLSQQIRLQNERKKEKKEEVVSILRKGRYTCNTTDDVNSNGEVINKSSIHDKNGNSNKQSTNENNRRGVVHQLHSLQSLSRMVSKVHFSKKLTDVRYYVVDHDMLQISNAHTTSYQSTPHDNNHTPLHDRNETDNDIHQKSSFMTESPSQHGIHSEEMDKKLSSSLTTTTTTTGQPTGEGEDKTKPPKVFSTDSMLLHTALNGTFEEMITCLRNGASARGTDSEKPIEKLKKVIQELEGEKDHLWKSISSSKISATSSSTNARNREQVKAVQYRLHCLKKKYSALKIFKEVEMAIDLSTQINAFRTFQFTVKSLNDVILTEEGKMITKNSDILFFKFYVSGIKQDKNSKPRITVPLQEHSRTFDDYVSSPPRCYASYNRTTDLKYRKGMVTVKVCLMKCSADFIDIDRSVQLASWKLSLDDIDCDVTVDEPQLYSDENPETKKCLSRYVFDAKVSINVSVVDQDKDYFKRKRQEYAKRLKDTLKSIHHFKRDTHKKTNNEPPLVDINITYFGTTSLLHAAVSLYAVDMIKELHKYGIDTAIKSEEYGTAMDLAVDLCEKAKARGDAKMVNGFQHIVDLLEKF